MSGRQASGKTWLGKGVKGVEVVEEDFKFHVSISLGGEQMEK